MNDISHRYKMHPPFLATMGVALFAIMVGDGFIRRIECMIVVRVTNETSAEQALALLDELRYLRMDVEQMNQRLNVIGLNAREVNNRMWLKTIVNDVSNSSYKSWDDYVNERTLNLRSHLKLENADA